MTGALGERVRHSSNSLDDGSSSLDDGVLREAKDSVAAMRARESAVNQGVFFTRELGSSIGSVGACAGRSYFVGACRGSCGFFSFAGCVGLPGFTGSRLRSESERAVAGAFDIRDEFAKDEPRVRKLVVRRAPHPREHRECRQRLCRRAVGISGRGPKPRRTSSAPTPKWALISGDWVSLCPTSVLNA